MLKVEGLGVIRVKYISEISFCESPLIRPNAPRALIVRVTTKNNPLIHAFK